MSTLREPVLVTGATGFIGKRLVARLVDDGLDVVALLLPDEPAGPGWGDRVRIVRGDVRDAASVEAAVDGVGTVFHLAALIGGASNDYDAHWAITAEGSRHVYDAATRAGARVVVTTSICAYGDRIARVVCHEDDERGAFQGPYGRAKQAQEDFARQAHERDGLAVTIVRPSNVYGPGSRPWVDMLAERVHDGLVGIIGDGTANAGLVHVDNLVDALVAIASNEHAVGRTYNVCDGLDVTWGRYIHDIARMVGIEELPTIPREMAYELARANEDPAALVPPKDEAIPSLEALNLIASDNRYDTTRIREEIGWRPRVGYEDALAEIEAYLKS